MKKPVALIIMDGWGLADPGEGNAVHLADTPNVDRLTAQYPSTTLQASGMAVGLPDGQMGNSEVGHMNLGAGRVVYQSLTTIHKAIDDGSFYENPEYQAALDHVNQNESKLHIMGLLSDGGVHSHINHFKAMLDMARRKGVKRTYVHAFLDGRDVPPASATKYVRELEDYIQQIGHGTIASVHGRYYAMDRDKNWDRIRKAYDVLTEADGRRARTAVEGIEASYEEGVNDEFVVPFSVDAEGTVDEDDAVVFMNFRPDRAIQMSTALTNPDESGLENPKCFENLHFVCTMHYSEKVRGSIAFSLETLDGLFGDVVSAAGLNQLRIAETEKYAHVTFFFDGGKDREIKNSKRVLIDSPKVATYDMQPEMSAPEVTRKVLEELDSDVHDAIILNYANGDMVGHTGDIDAAIKAVEATDEGVGKVVEKVLEKGGVAMVTADHGNAEKMLDVQGGVHTAHTGSPVPFILTDKGRTLREGGILGDIAPTMLEYLAVDQPAAMTGESLLKK